MKMVRERDYTEQKLVIKYVIILLIKSEKVKKIKKYII